MFSEKLRYLLRGEPVITVLTGAGISAESGVPTFRGEDGIWKKLKPEELANFDAFLKNPALVWEWYYHRQKLIKDIEPNRGHYALAELETIYKRFYLITQNIDNLHIRAGSKNPIELHGNIMRNRCIKCGALSYEVELLKEVSIPECSICNGMLRPDVVWFGEMLPPQSLKEANRAMQESTIFFSIGTSAQVQPAASMPIWAKGYGAYLVEINIEETLLTPYVDEFIKGKSGEILPVLLKEITSFKSK
jgi:NAD-dependent deacetylase